MKSRFCFLFILLLTTGCSQSRKSQTQADRQFFGKLADGREVYEYTLENKHGMMMTVINYGGIITSLRVPDQEGHFGNVVLGFDSLQGYLDGSPYFGALIGRYGNRIARGRFILDDQPYHLAQNNMGNHLHGGNFGFDKVWWYIESFETSREEALRLTYTSEDGEEGYPGTVEVEVVYTLTDDNGLKIDYLATTDKKTIINLTQHSYFNLSAGQIRDILSHKLQILANHFLPVDETLIPTGEMHPVQNSAFDFTQSKRIGQDIFQEHDQIGIAGGYDHCWVLRDSPSDTLALAAVLIEENSGRKMEVWTTEPGIQFYSGNFLDGTLTGIDSEVYTQHYGLCLETEHLPDSPNQPDFPTVILNPGDTYRTSTVYRFSTIE